MIEAEDDDIDYEKPLPREENEGVADAEEEAGETSAPKPFTRERRSNRNLWLISYSDFMTILMIFFLAMYGYTYLAKMNLMQRQNNPIAQQEFQKTVQEMKANLGDQLQIKDAGDKVVLQFGEKILFTSGSARLKGGAERTIEDLAKSIKLSEGMVVVEGHTDNVPIHTSRYPSNWELSAARAFSVIQALTNAGVRPERLAAWGFGDSRPIEPNLSDMQRSKNRRIEVVLLRKGAAKEMSHGG